ncbi:hypothetical protein [Pedobacter nyackensis]|uniref:hypothetical protein n=1 Tax=Pedobacter nyackensis TaxID=475255 RepID=UPI002931B285|nr:hypothetical protein [Pedobacter nyackensis]
MVVFVYAVFIFLILRFSVTLFNFLSNPKLGYYGKHFTDRVSVIVLSPNRQTDIKKIVTSIEEQEYRDVEVVVQRNETVTELMERATGKYFLFITAGMTLHHGLLNNLIYRVKVFELSVLSLTPTYTAHGFLANCIYPLNDFLLLNLFPLRLIRLSNIPAFAGAGSNDCLFCDATHFKMLGWNESLSKKMPSAAEVVRIAKQLKFKTEVLLANKFIRYNVDQIDINSFSSRLLLNFSNSGIAALFYVIFVVIGPLMILLNYDPALLLLPLGLIFMERLMIAFLTKQNALLQVFLHPLQMLALFILTLRAVGSEFFKSIKLKK